MKWISPFVYMLVYNDNGSVQTLCITRVSALCTKCLHRPIVIINQHIHKGWNSFYIFTLFSCIWILFFQSLSWKWLCFSWKSDGMYNKWKSLEKIVLCDSHHIYKEKINISQSFIIFNNESCFQTHLQHNYHEKNVERQYVTSPEMRMTSVISLHSNVTSITSQHV